MDRQAELSQVADRVRRHLDEVDQAREHAYRLQREVTRLAASTIRAIHRGDFAEAETLLADTGRLSDTMNQRAKPSPEVYHNGFVMDAQKEFAEAALLLALITGGDLPTPETLQIEPAPYLNGLAEASTELRRSVLDALKRKDATTAAELLDAMDSIYHLLVTFDYPDAIAYGLKRRLDTVRSVLERTQSDVLTSLREFDLQSALERLEVLLERQDT